MEAREAKVADDKISIHSVFALEPEYVFWFDVAVNAVVVDVFVICHGAMYLFQAVCEPETLIRNPGDQRRVARRVLVIIPVVTEVSIGQREEQVPGKVPAPCSEQSYNVTVSSDSNRLGPRCDFVRETSSLSVKKS